MWRDSPIPWGKAVVGVQVVAHCKKNGLPNAKIGRPASGFGSTFDKEVMGRVKSHKGVKRGWGPSTIWYELLHVDNISKGRLPSQSTIGRYLRQEGLSRRNEKNHPLDGGRAPEKAVEPHDCWQIDDMGAVVHPGVGQVILLNAKDERSSIYLCCQAKAVAHCRSHLCTDDYICALRKAFAAYGLPKRIQADHGNIFYENNSKSPFPTRFNLWLAGLGVEMVWSRAYRPTDQAKVERAHQTVHNQIRRTDGYADMVELQQAVDERIHMLNNVLPCSTYGAPPVVAFPNAKHSGKHYTADGERAFFSIQKVYDHLGTMVWYRKVSTCKTISLGGQVYYMSKAKAKSALNITFDPITAQLIFHEDKELLFKMPITGIDYDTISKI